MMSGKFKFKVQRDTHTSVMIITCGDDKYDDVMTSVCLSSSEVTRALVTLVNGHAEDCRAVTPSPLISPLLNDTADKHIHEDDDNRRKVRETMFQLHWDSIIYNYGAKHVMCHDGGQTGVNCHTFHSLFRFMF